MSSERDEYDCIKAIIRCDCGIEVELGRVTGPYHARDRASTRNWTLIGGLNNPPVHGRIEITGECPDCTEEAQP